MDPTPLLSPALIQLRQLFVHRGFDLRFVGGCVRDVMAGLEPKDIDLHTDATPDEAGAIYQEAGVRFIDTGLRHGTYTVVLDSVPYEITSLRIDAETDGRHARVLYSRDWLVDTQRRDFTINSMSLGFDGDLLDPFGGGLDLASGTVRFVGDPNLRIREDYLRILRWFRFRGRFGLATDSATAQAVRLNAWGLQQISVERIWSELRRILAGEHGITLIFDMDNLGVLRYCRANTPHPPRYTLHPVNTEEAQQLHQRTRNPVTLLSALCPGDAKTLLENFKASREEIDLAKWLRDSWGSRHSPFWYMAVDNVKREWAQELAALRGNWEPLDLAILDTWEVPQFPVTGYDLIKLGMKPGPEYAPLMRRLKLAWAASSYEMTRDQLLALV